MAKKKKKKTIATRIEKAAGDVADAVSVAATGFPTGVLELAAEEELTGEPVRRRPKKVVSRRSKRPAKNGERQRADRLDLAVSRQASITGSSCLFVLT